MCYVGSSANIGNRLIQHFAETRLIRSTALIHRAIREFGLDAFDIEVLEECPVSDLMQRERFYITLLGAATLDGFNTNATPANSRLGLIDSEVTRLRKSEAQKQRNLKFSVSQETRLKISVAAKSRGPISEETRRRMSEGQKGRTDRLPFTEERKARISAALKGKTVPAEVREKISATLKKLPPISKEARIKLSLAHKGKPMHPNSISAMRDGLKKWRAERKETPCRS